ncbi:MAG TPA: sulfatase-like hydrolase/transferase [Chlamydiales bacterium]|nr:sulfatase-like hydrolase/transferase [Chlamydiales bacterium]
MDPKREQINYLYFGGLFLSLVFIAAASIFTKENLSGSQFFFFLYALGQVVLEVALFVFLSLLIRNYLGKICLALFIGATFFALFLHSLDFMMDRILDLSAFESLKIFVLEENLENFFYLLDASGLPLWAWLTFFAVLGALPFLGFALYHFSDKFAKKRPFSVRHAHFLQAFICIPCALVFWDFSASKMIHPDAYTAFIKSLPWKFTFMPPQNVLLTLPGPVQEPRSEQLIAEEIEQSTFTPAKKPNIYLFVIESLREDCITADVAPHLHQFKNDYTHFDIALSGANASQISWFSIFHSQFPYCWNHSQKHMKMGSPPLNLLKKWGYQIHLYSSAQLGYYGMDTLLFGKEQALLTTHQAFHHTAPLSAADSDAAALAKLQEDLANPALQEGQVFIIFWDCTHFNYCWPKNWTPKFTPFAADLAYFKPFQSKRAITHIKNRYLNSIHYMDSLFGHFFAHLPNREDSIVVVMGDHGEEFFDHGHLFHNSHLTHEQIHIPLYFKFGKQEKAIASRSLASQIDIFPSIIDYLGGPSASFLQGNSLFQEARWPYVVTARFNAGLAPYEFSIHNGKNKMIAQFLNRENIFASKQLHILSLRTCDEKSIHEIGDVDAYIESEFGPALSRLFNTTQSAIGK